MTKTKEQISWIVNRELVKIDKEKNDLEIRLVNRKAYVVMSKNNLGYVINGNGDETICLDRNQAMKIAVDALYVNA